MSLRRDISISCLSASFETCNVFKCLQDISWGVIICLGVMSCLLSPSEDMLWCRHTWLSFQQLEKDSRWDYCSALGGKARILLWLGCALCSLTFIRLDIDVSRYSHHVLSSKFSMALLLCQCCIVIVLNSSIDINIIKHHLHSSLVHRIISL